MGKKQKIAPTHEGRLGKRGARKLGVKEGTKVRFVLNERHPSVAMCIRTTDGKKFKGVFLCIGKNSIVDVKSVSAR